jgi:hypothetical protein
VRHSGLFVSLCHCRVWRAKEATCEAMKEMAQADAAKRLNALEIITLILSTYVLIALLVQALLPLTPDAVALLDWVDVFVCVVFLTDFFVSFARAPSKRAYLIKWGWIDFLSSIPALPAFRVGRSSESFAFCVCYVLSGRLRICSFTFCESEKRPLWQPS